MPALRMMITSANLKVNLKVISHWKQFSFRESEIRLLLDFSKASVHCKFCFFLILVYIVAKLQWIKIVIIMKDLKNNIGLFLEFLKKYFNQFSEYLRFYHRTQHISKFTLSKRNLNFIRREFNYTLLIFKKSIKC